MINIYKTIQPNQTINNIKDFFKSLEQKYNLYLKEKECKKIIENIWTCSLELWFNNQIIVTSNGKGITKENCLASGYAELYERFANKYFLMNNPLLTNLYYKNLKKEKYQYTNSLKNYFNYLFKNDSYKEYLSSLYPEEKGELYSNILNNNDKICLAPYLLYRHNGSNGMCAGNSFEEAFSQGFFELIERHINYLFSQDLKDNNIIYKQINNKTIISLLPEFKELFITLQKENCELKILDLSYNYNLPVLCGIITNKNNFTNFINFGVHPDLKLNLSRILTEINQGICVWDKDIHYYQYPLYNTPKYDYRYQVELFLSNKQIHFPEKILNKIKIVDNFNINIFNNNFNNYLDIYNYIIKLIQEKRYQIYYINNSLTNNVFALHLYSPELTHPLAIFEDLNNAELDMTKYCSLIYYNFCNELYNTKQVNFKTLNILKNDIFNNYLKYVLYYLGGEGVLSVSSSNCNYIKALTKFNIEDLTGFSGANIFSFFTGTVYENKIKPYCLLKDLLDNEQYTIEEIKKYLYNFNFIPTEKDIENINNGIYWINNIIIKMFDIEIFTKLFPLFY